MNKGLIYILIGTGVLGLIIIFSLIFYKPFGLVKTFPSAGDQEIKLENFQFTATFNKNLNSKKTKDSFTISPNIKGEIKISGRSFIFTANEQLDPLVSYTINLTAYPQFFGKPTSVTTQFTATKYGFPKPTGNPADFE